MAEHRAPEEDAPKKRVLRDDLTAEELWRQLPKTGEIPALPPCIRRLVHTEKRVTGPPQNMTPPPGDDSGS